ncbi:MAG: hypothetical protein M3O71_06100 [Bacteroidota bacterium]|nr:hypothetical protein [Bacteroidota bacterium]
MNWKIIFQLSVFGLIMAFGTVSLIPQNVEPIFWVLIFAFCAFVIAKTCNGKYFLHGLLTGLVNCIWITIVHVFFFKTYLENHKQVDAMLVDMPASFATHPRVALALAGLGLGILSAIVFGLFAFVASKISRKK